jgi:hypothetical protein
VIRDKHPVVTALVAMLLFAASVRLIWELLRPALVPMSVIAVIAFIGYAVLRRV